MTFDELTLILAFATMLIWMILITYYQFEMIDRLENKVRRADTVIEYLKRKTERTEKQNDRRDRKTDN